MLQLQGDDCFEQFGSAFRALFLEASLTVVLDVDGANA